MKQIVNTYTTVSNYCTEALDKVLLSYGKEGYTLVSTTMADNKYGVKNNGENNGC